MISPAAGRCSSSRGEDACTQAMVLAERPGETARDIRGADIGTRALFQHAA